MISKRTSLPTLDILGESLPAFDFCPVTRVIFGNGALSRVGPVAQELGGKRVLMVTDPGIEEAGHASKALRSLEEERLICAIFDGVEVNPTTEHVDRCVAAAREHGADLLIGLGGGSAMDTAKGANFLLTNGGVMQDYWGVGKASKPMLPLIAVPTTAGTGSEAQSFALIADAKSHRKMACGDKKAAAKVAILDPEITLSQPPKVTATCGMDAVAHAVESYVTKARSPMSVIFAKEAWRHLSAAFPAILENPGDLTARGHMLLGAHLAGCAIENSMLGATHSAANPLTAHFDLPHGVAIGVLLPHVVRYNGQVAGELYGDLLDSSAATATDELAERLTHWVRRSGLPISLGDCGVDRDWIPRLAQEAEREWTAKFNPRPISAREFEQVYFAAYNGT